MPSPPEPRDRRSEFERIALPVAPALYRAARRLTRRGEDASDVVQETFLRAYRTFDNFAEGTNEKAWLFTILYSIMANRWDRDRRSPRELPLDDLDGRVDAALASGEPGAERALLDRLEASAEVDAALRALPEVYRLAVLLVDVEDLTYEEAAGVLGCPVGTLRSRLARGRRLLFVALHDYARGIRLRGGADV